MCWAIALNASAASLKPETVHAWDQYIQAARARMQQRLGAGGPFLWVDETPGLAARVRRGQIAVSPAGLHVPKKVPAGLIHDWVGAAFIPNETIHEVLPIIRDYGKYKEFYHPHVMDSRAIATGETEDRFSMVLMNQAIFAKIALESDYRVSYVRVDGQRSYSVSEATRIQEIAGYGMAGQHALPEDEGMGLIWRLYSVTRFEERDGGLYIEVEAVALSRDIPAALRWAAEPIVRRVSRESLATALRQTEDAMQATTVIAASQAEHLAGSSGR